MAEEQNNSSPVKLFNKGMNQDVDKKLLQNGFYIEGHNIQIISDSTGTSFDITNTKGNVYKLPIPKIPQVQEVKLSTLSIGNILYLTIAGNTNSINIVATTTLDDILNCINGITGYRTTFFTYIAGTHIVIYSPIGGSYCGDISSGGAGASSVVITNNYIPEQPDKRQGPYNIIGSVELRGDIYLYTTCCTDKNPGGHNSSLPTDASSVGQIWKMSYDKITLSVTLTLVYNQYIDFSTYWGIAPTATIGRYENDAIKRIYWTDNFNKIRQLNIANSNLLALDVTQLDIVPGVDFDIPIMTNRNGGGGSKPIGAYQCAYRYKNTGGAITGWSNLSNIIYLTQYDDKNGSDNFLKNVGNDSGTGTDQTITWTFPNLDRDFNTIEVAVVRRISSTASPDIFIVAELPIVQDTLSYTYTGNEVPIDVTLAEFLNPVGVFTHCKTIGSKDNRLFVANVRTEQQELDYDARAYRWNSDPKMSIVNNGVTETYTLATLDTIPDDADAINPSLYQPSPTAGFIYKSDGVTLGGEGLHISYEFLTIASECEATTITGHPDSGFSVPDDQLSPWRHTNPSTAGDNVTLNVSSIENNNTESYQQYPNNFALGKCNAGIKYNSISTLLRGYQRNEVYRFGIQFYDKSKKPYYVKWIGDIKFPDYWDYNANSLYENQAPTGIYDFRLVFTADNVNGVSNYRQAFVQHLGIKFTVNIPDEYIPLINGYSIVRVKREQKDKTITATGIINPCDHDDQDPQQVYITSVYWSGYNYAGNINPDSDYRNRCWFTCPNFCDVNQPVVFGNGDILNIKGLLTRENREEVMKWTGSGPYATNSLNAYFKYYSFDTTDNETSINITNSLVLTYGGTAIDDRPINNFDIGGRYVLGVGIIKDTTLSASLGNTVTYMRLASNIGWGDVASNEKKYFATITKVLSDQYGGNTFVARSNNQYLSCQQYRPIRSNSISDNFYLFGGDSWVQMYDDLRWTWNLGGTDRGQVDHTTVGHNLWPWAITQFFPTETTINTELRYGAYPNRMYTNNGGGEFHETYDYNGVFALENDIQVYFPKPYPYINNDIFDNRFYASEIKINGELTDNWGVFKQENYWDVEGIYGPVNAMRIMKDKMYFWQNRAFGIMEINPRVVLQDQNNTALQLGTGNVLQRHDYISTEVGLQHQWGVTWSAYKLFWLDVANRKFFNYSEGQPVSPSSDIKGMFSYFQNHLKYNINNFDKPIFYDTKLEGINGVRLVYDFKNEEVILCVTDVLDNETKDYWTLIYNDKLDAWVSFKNAQISTLFPTDGYKIFSTHINKGTDCDIYMENVGDYGRYYGVISPSKLSFVVNEGPTVTKTFDNLSLDVQSLNQNKVNQYTDFWNAIRVYDDSQNTDYQNFVVKTSYNTPTNWNVNRKERTWKLAIPRNRVINLGSESPDIFNSSNLSSPDNKPYGDRMRDKYFVVDLVYDNSDNNLLITNNITPGIRQSDR